MEAQRRGNRRIEGGEGAHLEAPILAPAKVLLKGYKDNRHTVPMCPVQIRKLPLGEAVISGVIRDRSSRDFQLLGGSGQVISFASVAFGLPG